MDTHPGSKAGSAVDPTVALSGAVVIPRTALYDGNTVFLAEEGRLAQRQVEIARFRHDEAVLSSGLRTGDKLVVSVLSAPVVGMKLRAMEVEPASADAAGTLTESVPARQRER